MDLKYGTTTDTKAEPMANKPSGPDRNSRDHVPTDGELDRAYWYLHESSSVQDANSAPVEYNRAIRRKIDWCIVPIMFCCYTMQFIDKVLLNYAAVMGLNRDLKLKGNNFSDTATAFFIAYLIAEIPNAIVLQKITVAKWLGANVILWGVATACTAAVHDFHSLLAVRIFLGIFEASIAPSLMLISSQWYTKSEQAPRFSIWYAGLGLGQIIGGIVSYAFQQVKHRPSFSGWRIMFVVLGMVTVVIGLVTLFFLPDTPMKGRFLSQQEKVALIKHVAVNETGISSKKYKISHILEVVLDMQIWLMMLSTILVSPLCPGTMPSSSMLMATKDLSFKRCCHNVFRYAHTPFGFSPPHSALLNMPSGIVSIASTLVVGFGVRYTSNRWVWLVACCAPGILGGGLLSFATHNRAAQLAGIHLVNTIRATLIMYHGTASNVAGSTKRVISVALIAGSFSAGNIIGPQTFRARDAPRYIPAKITVLATQAAAALVAVVLLHYYVWANRRKDVATSVAGLAGVDSKSEQELWANQTDKRNEIFRYVY